MNIKYKVEIYKRNIQKKMYKSKLNEFCQKNGFEAPFYLVADPDGPPHTPIFERCTILAGGKEVEVRQRCVSKKEIENVAAEEVLKKLEEMVISNTKKLVNNSAKTHKDSKEIFLVDYDNSSGISNLYGEIHLFVSMSFKLDTPKMKKIIEEKNITVHQATKLIPELADHMMTWFACKNLKKFRNKSVTILSRDKGLAALEHLLQEEGVNTSLKCFIPN